jgi:uncharacterized protein (TIGR00369 family)
MDANPPAEGGASAVRGLPEVPPRAALTVAWFEERSQGRLPGLLGVMIDSVERGAVAGRLPVRDDLLAPNGFLHAASVIGLADTCAGFGCLASLPDGGVGFTTVELKSNFLGTARDGVLKCRATLTHAGRSTQVWDAEVRSEDADALVALFRCTQMILYPRS